MMRGVGESIGDTVVETVGRAMGQAQEQRPLPVDLLESDDAYLAVFDSPGAMSSDIQVQFEEDAIVVRIDRFRTLHDGFEMQFPGRGLSLDGRVELPESASVDPDGANATLKNNGTLHVMVPKVTADDSTEEATADEDTDETDEE